MTGRKLRTVSTKFSIILANSNKCLSFLVKHSGNITFNDILTIARAMRERSMARKLEGTVKEVLGTAQSIGCTIDGRAPHDVIDAINDGEMDVPEK